MTMLGESMILRRPGRKRKLARRHPSGRLAHEDKRPDDRVRASRQPHRRVLREADRMSEKAESSLGQMLLTGRLLAAGESFRSSRPSARYDAGLMYARIVGQYRAVIETPRSTAGGGRNLWCMGCGDQARVTFCPCRNRKDRYDAAFLALSAIGRLATLAVNRVAVHNEELSPQDYPQLLLGLDALAHHFALTGERFRAYQRNAQ